MQVLEVEALQAAICKTTGFYSTNTTQIKAQGVQLLLAALGTTRSTRNISPPPISQRIQNTYNHYIAPIINSIRVNRFYQQFIQPSINFLIKITPFAPAVSGISQLIGLIRDIKKRKKEKDEEESAIEKIKKEKIIKPVKEVVNFVSENVGFLEGEKTEVRKPMSGVLHSNYLFSVSSITTSTNFKTAINPDAPLKFIHTTTNNSSDSYGVIIESEGYALGISFSSNGLSIVTDAPYRPRMVGFIGSENWNNINIGWTTSPPSAKLSLGEVGVSGSASTGKRVDVNRLQAILTWKAAEVIAGGVIVLALWEIAPIPANICDSIE